MSFEFSLTKDLERKLADSIDLAKSKNLKAKSPPKEVTRKFDETLQGQRYRLDTRERLVLREVICNWVEWWMTFVISMFILHAFAFLNPQIKEALFSDGILIALLGSNALGTIALLYVIVSGLFSKNKDKQQDNHS